MTHIFKYFKRVIVLLTFGLLFVFDRVAAEEKIELLSLDIIDYEDFMQEDSKALDILEKALHEKGIVGIRGVPGYKEKVFKFIESAKEFSNVSDNFVYT